MSITLSCDHKDCDREEEFEHLVNVFGLASDRMKQYCCFHPRHFKREPRPWFEVSGRIFCAEHGYEVDQQMTLASRDKKQSILAAALKESD